MSVRAIHTGDYIKAKARREIELNASAFDSGTVLLTTDGQGVRISTHLDAAGARALAASLIECADAIEAQQVAA